jgi:uncharacterized protein DUF4332
MTSSYHIDLAKYSLETFKGSLKNRNMIPSRVILKEKIDDRFKVLSKNGIEHLAHLITQLKTKQKVETFSKQSGLSAEYLTILKREAGSYLPNPVKLDKFPGVDLKSVTTLELAGIKHTKHLFDRTNEKEKLKLLLNSTGIDKTCLEELKALSDLARIYGVGPVFARIIYDVGVRSVEAFKGLTARSFIQIYEYKMNKKADFGENEISFSIELAKELDTLLQ